MTEYHRPSCFDRPRSTWDRHDYLAVRTFNERRRQAKQERTAQDHCRRISDVRALFMQETTT